MATDMLGPSYEMSYVNTDTRLGDDVLGPGFADDLEQYYDKAVTTEDRAKCLELLTSLKLGGEVRDHAVQRPHTAIGTVTEGDHSKNPFSVYQTTYNKDYPLKYPQADHAMRPMTSNGIAQTRHNRIEATTYDEAFNGKMQRPNTPIRAGSSSGTRCNNPHPSQAFMVWKFPKKGYAEHPSSKWSEELTNDKMNQVYKRLCQSTYQSDYLAIPQGFQVKSAFSQEPDWKENIPYTIDSVKRFSYQRPEHLKALQLPTNRYGSNKKKMMPAVGTIPTASSRYMHVRSRTTYDRHFNDNAGPVIEQIREISRKLGTDALKKYYESATGQDKETIGKLLQAYGGYSVPTPSPPRPPARPPSRISNPKSLTPASTPVSTLYVPSPPPRAPSSNGDIVHTYSPPCFLT
ncbi:hypothetical protein ACJMK2_032327 [Sinanodonta woodiana]|uniref:Testis-expressed protein 26 n=1 Tax=Sinanodonta woodiana TaxID=1069815 RepID=A0ABD3X1D3_SINWO